MSELNQKNSIKQGDVGVARAIYEFSSKGFIVSKPLSENSPYDLIIDDSNTLKKVQVKTSKSKSKHGAYIVELRTKGGNKSGQTIKLMNFDDIDLLFVLCENGSTYLIPSDKINGKGIIYVGKTKYNEYLFSEN